MFVVNQPGEWRQVYRYGWLLKDLQCDMASDVGVESADSLGVDHEVAGRECLRPDEGKHLPVYLRPVRFHEVVDQCLPSRLADVQIPDTRIEPDLGDGDAHLASQRSRQTPLPWPPGGSTAATPPVCSAVRGPTG